VQDTDEQLIGGIFPLESSVENREIVVDTVPRIQHDGVQSHLLHIPERAAVRRWPGLRYMACS